MSDLQVLTPRTLEEAVALLADDGAIAIGGGTSTAMMLKAGLLDVSTLVNLGRLALSGIAFADNGTIAIGGTTIREIAASPRFAGSTSALTTAARVVGNPRVRAVATVGGTIVHGDPRQDVPPALLALGGSVTLASTRGTREVPLSEFFVGFMESACREDEIVTRIVIGQDHDHSAYVRFNPASEDDYAVVAVAASLALDATGRINSARIALGGAAATVILAEEASELMLGEKPSRDLWHAAANTAMRESDPTSDRRGSVEYKRQMVSVITERALTKLAIDVDNGLA